MPFIMRFFYASQYSILGDGTEHHLEWTAYGWLADLLSEGRPRIPYDQILQRNKRGGKKYF